MSVVPVQKTSRSRTRRRHSKWAHEQKRKLMKRTKLVPCPQCHELKLAHSFCPECGAYGSVKEEIAKTPTKKTEQKTVSKKPAKTEKKASKKKSK